MRPVQARKTSCAKSAPNMPDSASSSVSSKLSPNSSRSPAVGPASPFAFNLGERCAGVRRGVRALLRVEIDLPERELSRRLEAGWVGGIELPQLRLGRLGQLGGVLDEEFSFCARRRRMMVSSSSRPIASASRAISFSFRRSSTRPFNSSALGSRSHWLDHVCFSQRTSPSPMRTGSTAAGVDALVLQP